MDKKVTTAESLKNSAVATDGLNLTRHQDSDPALQSGTKYCVAITAHARRSYNRLQSQARKSSLLF
jgi:hypothetical protein